MVSQTLSMTVQQLMLTSMLTTRDVRLQVTAEELVTMAVPITAVLTITAVLEPEMLVRNLVIQLKVEQMLQ